MYTEHHLRRLYDQGAERICRLVRHLEEQLADAAVRLTPRRLINRLQRRRDDILRFMADPSVPFDNNGSERDPQRARTGLRRQPALIPLRR